MADQTFTRETLPLDRRALIAWANGSAKAARTVNGINGPLTVYSATADHFDAIAAQLEADAQLREVIQQEVDNEHLSHREATNSLGRIALAAGLWPKGEQVPAPFPPVVSGWQPIATAPKDGRDVLLWWPFWCVGRPTIGFFGYKGIQQWCAPEALEGDGDPPTHWMPLPAPPTSEGK